MSKQARPMAHNTLEVKNLSLYWIHPYFCDFKNEFCKVKRNHVAFPPARKTHSISVLALLQGRNHAHSSSDTDFSIIFPELKKIKSQKSGFCCLYFSPK